MDHYPGTPSGRRGGCAQLAVLASAAGTPHPSRLRPSSGEKPAGAHRTAPGAGPRRGERAGPQDRRGGDSGAVRPFLGVRLVGVADDRVHRWRARLETSAPSSTRRPVAAPSTSLCPPRWRRSWPRPRSGGPLTAAIASRPTGTRIWARCGCRRRRSGASWLLRGSSWPIRRPARRLPTSPAGLAGVGAQPHLDLGRDALPAMRAIVRVRGFSSRDGTSPATRRVDHVPTRRVRCLLTRLIACSIASGSRSGWTARRGARSAASARTKSISSLPALAFASATSASAYVSISSIRRRHRAGSRGKRLLRTDRRLGGRPGARRARHNGARFTSRIRFARSGSPTARERHRQGARYRHRSYTLQRLSRWWPRNMHPAVERPWPTRRFETRTLVPLASPSIQRLQDARCERDVARWNP